MAAEMTEAQLQTLVLDYCRMRSVLAYHTHDSRRSQPGYPDLTLVGDRGMLFVELKNETYAPTPEQLMWGDALTDAGQHWQLWRPRSWHDGTICQQINALGRCSALMKSRDEQARSKALAMLQRRNERFQG